METVVETGMAALLTTIGTVVTSVTGWAGDVLDVIMASGNELLLIGCIIPFVGVGIGFLKRLLG